MKKRLNKANYFGVAIVIITNTLTAHAALLTAWDVNGVELDTGTGIATNEHPYTMYSTFNASHVSGMMTLGAGVNRSTSIDEYGFKVSASDKQTTLSGAITEDHYIQFSIQVDNGYQINLESIFINGDATATGCSNVVLMSSMDGFEDGKQIQTFNPAQSELENITVEMVGSQYQELSGTVDFRLYGWNSSSGSGVTRLIDGALGDNELIINGSIETVPEPTVINCIVLSGAGMLLSRRIILR